jgi:hypothetical protein
MEVVMCFRFFVLFSFFWYGVKSWGAEWQPGAQGAEIVEAAVRTTQHLFSETELADISVFLRRIARAESECGRNSSTYRPHYFGGVWQMDRVAYEETKRVSSHPNLAKWHCTIQKKAKKIGYPLVEWASTRWEHLAAPVYSCVAARLYLACIPAPVPSSLSQQAAYWKKHYNTPAGSGTEHGFLRANQG